MADYDLLASLFINRDNSGGPDDGSPDDGTPDGGSGVRRLGVFDIAADGSERQGRSLKKKPKMPKNYRKYEYDFGQSWSSFSSLSSVSSVSSVSSISIKSEKSEKSVKSVSSISEKSVSPPKCDDPYKARINELKWALSYDDFKFVKKAVETWRKVNNIKGKWKCNPEVLDIVEEAVCTVQPTFETCQPADHKIAADFF